VTRTLSDETFAQEHGSYLCAATPGLEASGTRPGTCLICACPVTIGYPICPSCDKLKTAVARSGTPPPVNFLAFLTYAVEGKRPDGPTDTTPVKDTHEREGRQAYLVLSKYKTATRPDPPWMAAVEWAFWFIHRWGPWAEHWDSGPAHDWVWATVPSVRSGRAGEHPLHRIVSATLKGRPEATLRATGPTAGRDFNPDVFVCDPMPEGSSALLVEDSWASGSNLLNAAAALKRAGSRQVNAMVLGRLLNPGAWPPAREFIDSGGLRAGFVPSRSPWARIDTVL
jgi:hypothetical protein